MPYKCRKVPGCFSNDEMDQITIFDNNTLNAQDGPYKKAKEYAKSVDIRLLPMTTVGQHCVFI